jgi:aldose 1-epimerase
VRKQESRRTVPGWRRIAGLGAVAAALMSLPAPAGAADGNLRVTAWGRTPAGQNIERVSVENALGMRASWIDYAATITSIEVPDRRGERRNILLSLPDLPAYLTTRQRHAAVIGRYAGRINNARYTLDGRTVQLQPNARGINIHGGAEGFDRRIWRRDDFNESESLGSVFHLISPDGDQHFPGRLDVSVTYRLARHANVLTIEYAASTDAPTVVNLTNHGYFNLAGAGTAGLAGHRFQIAADRYLPTDARRVPTGEIRPVADTPLDFRTAVGIADRLATPGTLLGDPPGFDHSLLFANWRGALAEVADIVELNSGRRMKISTTEPSVQFYSANGMNGSEIGSEGRAYQRHDGFAFETQHLPDSPNRPEFPTTALFPGQTYRSQTQFAFSVLPE